MANIYDSEIRCADKKALNKLTKLILKHTPSRILGKTKEIALFETQWSDLDYAMEVFSQDFPDVTFSCSFIHMTACYAFYYTYKDYRNGIVTYKGLKPSFFYNSADLQKINLDDYKDCLSKFTTYFRTMYEEKKSEDGTYYLDYIIDRYRTKCVNFYPQARAEFDECVLTATLEPYSNIRLELSKKNPATVKDSIKPILVEDDSSSVDDKSSNEYYDLPF